MPTLMQQEVLQCLNLLEISPEKTAQSINIKLIKDQYLKLAQMYHPDVMASRIGDGQEEQGDDAVDIEERFVEVKEAFDKLVEINDQYGGHLLVDPEAELAE